MDNAVESSLLDAEAPLDEATNPNRKAQVAIRKLIEMKFHRHRGLLTSDKAMAQIAQELGLLHSSNALPCGRMPSALRIGALHAGPLRSILVGGINKVTFENEHAVKKTITWPALGRYVPQTIPSISTRGI